MFTPQAPAEFPEPPDCRYTWNPRTRRLYLHFFSWPFKFIHLPAMADRIVGVTAVGGILAALVARQTSGRGQRVDVPMFETMVGFVLGDHLGGLSFEPPLDAGAVKLMAALPLSGVAVSMTGAPGTAQLAGSTRQPKSASAPT